MSSSSNSGICYCCVATQNPFTRVIQYAKNVSKAEMNKIVDQILEKVDRSDHRRILTYKNWDIYYLVSKGVCFICVANRDFKKRICFALLEDLEQKWHKGEIKEYKGEKKLKERMMYFNDTKNDKLTLLNDRVEEVKETMIENIDKVLDRGEKLEDVQASSEQLMDSALLMKRKARTIKRNAMCRWLLLATIIAAVIFVIAFIIVIIIVVSVCPKFRCK